MDADIVREFYEADTGGRLAMAADPARDSALARQFGAGVVAELRSEFALAGGGRATAGHLGASTPKNLVFLPGVMGSLLRPTTIPAGIWWIDARAHHYIDQLGLAPDGGDPAEEERRVEAFQIDLSYTAFLRQAFRRNGFGVECFPYDWRKPYWASVDRLKDLVERLHAGNGGRKIHLVAHSMGGLIVRAALAQHGEALWPKIGRVVFLGTPHYGSPAIAFYLKNHFWGTDLKALLALVLSRDTFRSLWGPLSLLPAPRGIYPGTRPGQRHPQGPSTAGEPYDHPCVNFDPYDAGAWNLDIDTEARARLQRVLDGVADTYRRLDEAHLRLAPERRNRMAVIAGVGYKTPARLANSTVLGLWPQMRKEFTREGDGSVPRSSAELERVGAVRYVSGEHGALPNYPSVVDNVFRWLAGEPLTLPISPQGAAGSHLGAPPQSSPTPHLDGSLGDERWDLEEPPGERIDELHRALLEGRLPEFNRVRLH